MRRKPVAFMSYAHVDNKYGQLSEFRERLSHEVHMQTGEEFPIFQDRDDISLGQNWRQRIEEALAEEVTFLIPIITVLLRRSNGTVRTDAIRLNLACDTLWTHKANGQPFMTARKLLKPLVHPA